MLYYEVVIRKIKQTKNILLYGGWFRGFVKLKKSQKFEKNSDWPDPTHPPLYPIFFFWGNMFNKKNTTKNRKKQKNSTKKNNPSWGLTHPPTSEFFSDFWNFFNLTKPLSMFRTIVFISCFISCPRNSISCARNQTYKIKYHRPKPATT